MLNCPACAMKRRICVFCGSSLRLDDSLLTMVRDVAQAIVGRDWNRVRRWTNRIDGRPCRCSAGSRRRSRLVSYRVRLASAEIAHDGLTHLEVVESMHVRKARMADWSQAFVALPGGFRDARRAQRRSYVASARRSR